MAPDIGYTDLLTANGHEVTRIQGVNDIQNTATLAQLNSYDLVVISRSVDSGFFENDGETAGWASVTAPMMLMSGYTLRNVRLGLTTGGTIPDTSGAIRLTVNNPAHPIFAGIALDGANTMVNQFSTGLAINPITNAVQRGISVNTDPIAAGGTVLAVVGTPGDAANGGMIIGEWNAGGMTANTPADTLAGKRLTFLSGGRETNGVTSQTAGIFDLDADGQTLFLNAVEYLGGPGFQRGDVDNDGDVDLTDFGFIRDNFQQSAASRGEGDLNGDGSVDWVDYRQWKDNHPFPVTPSFAVPEPASAALIATIAVTLITRRRRTAT
jgi:hypothetical protein